MRRMRREVLGGALALLFLAVDAAFAQSLGELARQEEAKRKAAPKAVKIYTNETLRADATPPAAPAPTTPATSPASTPPAASTPGQTPAAAAPADAGPGDEATWRKRMAAARDNLARAQTFLEALQTR